MADGDDLEYPRWEHHPDHESVLVNTPAERAALLDTWAAGKPLAPPIKPFHPASSLTNAGVAEASATAADLMKPEPAFTIYDIGTDSDVPLTQDRLDDLTFAEDVLGVIWPAISRDRKAEGVVFPPETTEAITKVQAILDERAVAETAEPVASEPTAPKRRPGRPAKPKPEATPQP